MFRRERVPARLADAGGARKKEGPLLRSPKGESNGPAIGANFPRSSNGRTPALTSEAT
jgi:hypothetical protein